MTYPCPACRTGNAYAFDLATSSSDSLVYLAAALRSKDHTQGSGYTERMEVHAGNGGSTAGLATADGTAGATPSASSARWIARSSPCRVLDAGRSIPSPP